MLFKIAWRNIWRNKRRSLITAASVAFALFFALAMRSMQLGTYQRAYDNVINATTGYLQIQGQGYWEQQSLERSFGIDQLDTADLLRLDEVEALVPRLQNFTLVASAESAGRPALMRGIDPQAEQCYFGLTDRLVAGQIFASKDRAVLLGKDLAQQLQVSSGDTIVLIGQGYHGISANAQYPVAGLVNFQNPEMNRRSILLPLAEAQWLTGAENRLTALTVVPAESKNLASTALQIKNRLPDKNLEVLTWRQMMPELIQALEADSAGGIVVLIILYLVIGFGVFGTILMLTAERKAEFGILISIGMSRSRLALTVFLETTFLGLLGVLTGSFLAWPLAWYYHQHPIDLSGELTDVMDEYGFEPVIPFSLDPSIWFLNGGTVLLITILLSLYAVLTIHYLQPVKAMRP